VKFRIFFGIGSVKILRDCRDRDPDLSLWFTGNYVKKAQLCRYHTWAGPKVWGGLNGQKGLRWSKNRLFRPYARIWLGYLGFCGGWSKPPDPPPRACVVGMRECGAESGDSIQTC